MTAGPTLLLLTGAKGSGKSRFLSLLIERLRLADPDFELRGLLSPAVRERGEKTAIDVIDLASGDRRHLARPVGSGDAGPATPHWSFNQATIDWANERLAKAADAPLLVVDELGWLEFEQGQGFTRALDLLDRRAFRVALVTVRPDLLARARARWEVDCIIRLAPTEEIEGLAQRWSQRLLGQT